MNTFERTNRTTFADDDADGDDHDDGDDPKS